MDEPKGRVLIIDKYHNTLAPLLSTLEDYGCEVILAIKLTEAHDALFKDENTIDCTIINVIEPVQDDIFETISSLIDHTDNLKTPLIVYTSKLPPKTADTFYELGVFQIIEKPCSSMNLSEMIMNLVKLKNSLKSNDLSRSPLFLTLMENTPIEIAVLDNSYSIQDWNRSFADSHENVIQGSNFFESCCGDDFNELSEHPIIRATENMTTESGNVIINESGEQKHYNIIATPVLNSKGHIEAVLVQSIDQTSQIVMEKKLRRQVQNFNRILKEQDRTTDYLISVQKDLQKKGAELEKLSITDYLTGINNRRKFNESIKAEALRASRYNHPLSLLLIDIDNFKSVNDTYGHPFGDVVLKSLTTVLQLSIRETDILSRYGGEEFAIILPETEYETAKAVSERVRANIEKRKLTTNNGEMSITVSVGLTTISSENIDPDKIIQLSDECLYEAKKLGKNRVEALNLS